MLKTEELLWEREINALRFATFARVAFFLIWIVSSPFLSKSLLETVLTLVMAGNYFVYLVFAFIAISKKKFITQTGYSGAAIDIFTLTLLPVIWYFSVGGTSISPAYMVKGPTYYGMLTLFLCLNSLTIQPGIILTYTSLATLSQSGFLVYQWFVNPSGFTSDYVQHNLGSQVSPVFSVTVLVTFMTSGIIMAILARTFKKTIFSAVSSEVATNQLGRYFSPSVRENLMSDVSADPLGEGREQHVAVLFSDIRNFTTYSEEHTPAQVLELLHRYHSRMVDTIFTNNGTLDKFIGDGIMATFGTPHTSEHDARNAAQAALDMTRALEELNVEFRKENRPTIVTGIGIHYGPAIVGNVGSQEQLEYTVIGDTVNIASRLESATKDLGQVILVSRSMAEIIEQWFITERQGDITLKGKREPVEVYRLAGKK